MGITHITDKASVARFFDQALDIMARQMKIHLQLLGEHCVNRIRKKHKNDWTDRTGNLRSSIGHAVYEQGKTVFQGKFESIKEGATGSAKGRALIQDLAKEYANVYALVVLAGMNYASFVEEGGQKNRKPKDVLASTTLWANAQISKYLEQAERIAIQQINKIKLRT